MSGMSKEEWLRRMRNCRDCLFIGEQKCGYYHKKDCPYVEQIMKKDLVACGLNQEN